MRPTHDMTSTGTSLPWRPPVVLYQKRLRTFEAGGEWSGPLCSYTMSCKMSCRT